MLHFFDTYEEQYERAAQEEEEARARRLEYLNQKHGQVFDNLIVAERFNEQAAYNRFMDELHRHEEEQARQVEFVRRGSPLPIIEAWEHGSL